MKKWTLVEQALTPDGKTIALRERDGTWEIAVDAVDLMSTRRHASEEKLAELACAHLKTRRRARVLIGGLGMGFTLKAALACLAPDAKIVVAELMPAVIAWNRNAAYPFAAAALADPRVSALEQDVVDVLRTSPASFDSILLDVDNGPSAVTTASNARLYRESGLKVTKAALKAGGCAAWWSAASDPSFEKLLRRAGFTVEVQRCQAHTTSGAWHTIFLGK